MKGETSRASSSAPKNCGLDSSRQKQDRDISRLQQKLRQRSSSFSSACSQSTISTKPPIQSDPPPPTREVAKRTSSTTASQSTLSTRPSVSSRQQRILSMVKRTRSSGSSQAQNQAISSTGVDRNLPKVRSFSSVPKPPKHPVTSNPYAADGLVSKRGAGIPRISTPSSRPSPNPLFNEVTKRTEYELQSLPRPISGRVDSNASRRSTKSSTRTTFHVRLSIGYMTGLKMEKIAKWVRQSTNNRIIVGFVELASSGKYTALSQPLLTNVGEETTRVTKVLWANSRKGRETSKMRRRLHFSLHLERDCAVESRQGRNDDDSFSSLGSYAPEVVKLLVGLKCGDEKLNLGTAKLVVNGRETVEQKMDLPIQSSPTIVGPKVKRGLFGKKQQKNSFTNGEHSFKLALNSTLRVKADIRTGLPGQDGAAIWGKDDASYTTNWTYDTSTAYPSPHNRGGVNGIMDDPSSYEMMTSSSYNNNAPLKDKVAVVGLVSGTGGSLFGESPTDMQYDPSAGRYPRMMHRVPPIPIVSLRKPEDKSYMSGLTGPESGCDGSWWTKACLPLLCGDVDGSKNSSCHDLVAKSFSFETVSHRLSSGSTSTDDSSTNGMEDLKGTTILISNETILPSRSKKRHQPALHPTHVGEEQLETLDVTVETFNDLKDAQETLMRYANKVGVDMEDLLDEMEQTEKKDTKRYQSKAL